jgi:hypothetical protein
MCVRLINWTGGSRDISYHDLHVTVYISNDTNGICYTFLNNQTNVLCAAESDKGEKYISRTAEEC